MAKCWSATVVAVALLACIVGSEPNGKGKASTPPSQPDQHHFIGRTFSKNPSSPDGFSQGTPWDIFQAKPQIYPGNAQLYPSNPQSTPPGNQWPKPAPQPAYPLPSQTGNQWAKPAPQPAYPLPSQTGNQWTKPAPQPAYPLPSQTGNQWTNPAPQPAYPLPSQTGNQWTNPAPQPAYPLPSQTGNQWTKPAPQPAYPLPSQTGNPQYPKNPQWPTGGGPSIEYTGTPANPQGTKNPQTPLNPPILSCNVAANVRVPCGPARISAADCQAIDCCFDGQSCYFGKAVTVQCTKDGQFVVVVAKDTTLPRLDLASTSLLETGNGCTYVDSNSQFAIYQFPVTKCGSQIMEDGEAIVYQNRLFCLYEVAVGPYGAITRDSQFELLFQCTYNGSAVETIVMEVIGLNDPVGPIADLGPINVQLRLANGQCQTKGCNEVDAAYTSYYRDADYPVTKVLRDPVYVEVQLMDMTDPLLVLQLGRCWVTTSPNPHDQPQWDILTDGCAYKDDRYLSTVVPIGPSAGLNNPSHYRRFFFKMFTFVDTSTLSPLTQQIYVHCSTDVCTAGPTQSCEPSCYRQRRDIDAVVMQNAEPRSVGSVGPLLISKPHQ